MDMNASRNKPKWIVGSSGRQFMGCFHWSADCFCQFRGLAGTWWNGMLQAPLFKVAYFWCMLIFGCYHFWQLEALSWGILWLCCIISHMSVQAQDWKSPRHKKVSRLEYRSWARLACTEDVRLVQGSWSSAGTHIEAIGSIGSCQVGARILWEVGGCSPTCASGLVVGY